MAITNTELMFNKMKCHALEIIRKVSCAASQQLRRRFNVFAESQLRSARWVHKQDLTSSIYPSLNFRRLLIKVLYSHWVSGWDHLGEEKKCLFLLYLSQLSPFASLFQQLHVCIRSYSTLENTLLLPGGFGAVSAPPWPSRRIKSTKFVHLQGFSAHDLLTLGLFGAEVENCRRCGCSLSQPAPWHKALWLPISEIEFQ